MERVPPLGVGDVDAAGIVEERDDAPEGGAPVDVLESWRTGLGFGALEPAPLLYRLRTR